NQCVDGPTHHAQVDPAHRDEAREFLGKIARFEDDLVAHDAAAALPASTLPCRGRSQKGYSRRGKSGHTWQAQDAPDGGLGPLRRRPQRQTGADQAGTASAAVGGRNFTTAVRPSTTNSASTTSCAIMNGGSACVGARSCTNGIFRNAWTTATKEFR